MLIPLILNLFLMLRHCQMKVKNSFLLWGPSQEMHLNVCWTVEEDDSSYQL